MRALRSIALTVICTSVACPTFAAPFLTVDQNPLLNGFAFAPNAIARLPTNDTTLYSSTLNWSSTAVIQDSENELLVVDTESQELRLSFAHAFSNRLTLRMQMPYRISSGGALDGFIDDWHSLFGLPNGDRPALPQNDFRIDYERAGQTLIRNTEGGAGVGDISMAAGYQLSATPTRATSLWINVKAPTGNSAELTGSGATDVTLSLAHEHQLSSRWQAYTQLNVSYLGTGELPPEQQRNSMLSGMLAFDYRYSRALALTLQLDAHTTAFTASNLALLGDAWILTVGGEYRWPHWYIQVGVSEDIKVEASPDVNFVLSVGKTL